MARAGSFLAGAAVGVPAQIRLLERGDSASAARYGSDRGVEASSAAAGSLVPHQRREAGHLFRAEIRPVASRQARPDAAPQEIPGQAVREWALIESWGQLRLRTEPGPYLVHNWETGDAVGLPDDGMPLTPLTDKEKDTPNFGIAFGLGWSMCTLDSMYDAAGVMDSALQVGSGLGCRFSNCFTLSISCLGVSHVTNPYADRRPSRASPRRRSIRLAWAMPRSRSAARGWAERVGRGAGSSVAVRRDDNYPRTEYDEEFRETGRGAKAARKAARRRETLIRAKVINVNEPAKNKVKVTKA